MCKDKKRQDLVNQLKNWVFDHFVLVLTAPVTEAGEEYKWIIPSCAPGEDLEKYCVRLEKAVSKARKAISVENATELKQKAGILVDLVIEFLLVPIEKDFEIAEQGWAEIKAKVDKLDEKDKSKIIVPSNQEVQKLGN